MRSDELYHYGVKGQKWGVRRYQNSDGSYTDEGKRRYGRIGAYRTLADGRIAPNGRVTKVTRGVIDDYNNMDEKAFRGKYATTKSTYLKRLSKYDDPYKHAKNSGWYKAAKKISKPMLERRTKIRKAMNWTNGDDWQEPGAERIGKTNWAPNYSESQRAEDRRVYSRGAVRRINKRLLNGETIKGSRSAEADRIHRYRSASNIAGKIGSAVGTVAGGAGAYYLSRKFGHGSLRDPIAVGAASMGAGIGNAVGRSIGGRGTMILGGYGRKRRR